MLAVMSSIAAAAYLMSGSLVQTARSTKLSADVATLNNAVRVYLTNGGRIPAGAQPEQIVERLKMTSTAASGVKLAGIRGTMLDARLRGELVTAAGGERAVWNGTRQRFEIRSTGKGFRSFDLSGDPAAVVAEEERQRTLDLATKTNWVWDFEDSARSARAPQLIETSDVAIIQPREPSAMSRLMAPAFSMPGALYDITAFKPTMPVSLVDRNMPGTARLFYSIDNGPWLEYTGTPLQIPPQLTTTIRTYAAALDGENYEDSEPVTQKYETIYFTGTSAGNFHSPVGDGRLVTNIGAGQKRPDFKWGQGAGLDKKQNELKFTGTSFERIAPDQEFVLGALEYFNGTTAAGTNATGVQIAIDLNMSTPGVTESLSFFFKLYSTPNNGKSANDDADFVYIPDVSTNFRTAIKGKQFQLILRFGEHSANGFTTIDTFHAHEGKTLKGTIYGRLSEVK